MGESLGRLLLVDVEYAMSASNKDPKFRSVGMVGTLPTLNS